MKSTHRTWRVLLPSCFFLGMLTVSTGVAAGANITVNPAVIHQTIRGWEITDYFSFEDTVMFPVKPSSATIDQVFQKAVDEVGINRIRVEVRSSMEHNQDYYLQYKNGTLSYEQWRCLRYSTANDNNDPYNLNLAGFHFTDLDERIDKMVLPLRQKLQARGEKLHINMVYTAFVNQMTGSACSPNLTYHHDDSPEEYAEFILAMFVHMQSKYGFVPDTVEVILEPDNTPFWRGKQIGQAIVATARMLASRGFSPKFVAPSTTNMSNAVSYFDELVSQVPEALQYMSDISYHRYSGVSDTALQNLAARARTYNLGTSMLEWWSSSNNYKILHKDLKMGNNSAWEQADIAGPTSTYYALYSINNSNPSSPVIALGPMARYTRHYFQYVRYGAVRVEAQSDTSAHDPIAFRNPDGKYVVVSIASAAGSFSVTGLPAGTYGVMYSSTSNTSQIGVQAPDVTIGAGQALTTSVPSAAVVTIYAKSNSPAVSPCDLNSDLRVDASDVQLSINQALGIASCGTADVTHDGKCDAVDVQRIINSSLGSACRSGS